jgi:hypothetical protein
MSIFKVVTSFTQNLEYGELFNVQINIWIYRVLWFLAGAASAYSLLKFYRDKKRFGQ